MKCGGTNGCRDASHGVPSQSSHVAVKIAIEGNKYCPIHLDFRIRLNDLVFTENKKLSSEFKHVICV